MTADTLHALALSAGDHMLLAQLTRGGLVESWHRGVATLTGPDGHVLEHWGPSKRIIYPRSAVKPLQAVAVRRAGLTLEGAALAVSSGSHSGSAEHVALVEQILGSVGLGVDALQCPLAWPSNSAARTAATEQRREYFNCSGKHAAFLAACVGAGWSTHDYLAPEHPLQKLIVDVLEEFADEKILHTTVDGCGAPLHTLTVEGLARATGKFALEQTEIAAALKANGWAIGDREAADSLMLDAGLVAKVGAEGVYVVGTADGHGLAIKVADGSMRAMAAVAVAILAKHDLIGADVAAELSAKVSPRVLGGGADVGRLEVMI